MVKVYLGNVVCKYTILVVEEFLSDLYEEWMDDEDHQHHDLWRNMMVCENGSGGIRTCRLIGFISYMVGFFGTLK